MKWLGTTKWNGELELEEEQVIVVPVLFSKLGVFDIQTWKMNTTLLFPVGLINEENAGTFVQTPTLPHLITIT